MSWDQSGWNALCRQADKRVVRVPSNLPRGWESMTVGGLWEVLNRPRRGRKEEPCQHDILTWEEATFLGMDDVWMIGASV
jgi:predicted dithiol-disulfide oxidoreductase (DUF899 family)